MTINQTTKPQAIDVCDFLNANPGIKAVVGAICEEYVRAGAEYYPVLTDVAHAAALVAEDAGRLLRTANHIRWVDDNVSLRETLLKEAVMSATTGLRFLINIGELKGGE